MFTVGISSRYRSSLLAANDNPAGRSPFTLEEMREREIALAMQVRNAKMSAFIQAAADSKVHQQRPTMTLAEWDAARAAFKGQAWEWSDGHC